MPLTALAENLDEGQELEKIVTRLTESEAADANAFFRIWINPKLEESLSKTHLNNSGIEAIYEQFKDTITTMSSPDSRGQREAEYGEDRCIKIYQFGMIVNSMLLYLPEKEIGKYGKLLWAMRDILYVDLQYVAWGIQGNFSRDGYFYKLHTKWLQKTEDSYFSVCVGIDGVE